MIPLLHCEIGICNQLLDKLWVIINEHIACYSPGKEAIHVLIPVNKNIIAHTAKQRNKWDESAYGEGLKLGTLMRAGAAYSKRREMVLTNNNEQEELTHRIK
jgi:hypothetical protein